MDRTKDAPAAEPETDVPPTLPPGKSQDFQAETAKVIPAVESPLSAGLRHIGRALGAVRGGSTTRLYLSPEEHAAVTAHFEGSEVHPLIERLINNQDVAPPRNPDDVPPDPPQAA